MSQQPQPAKPPTQLPDPPKSPDMMSIETPQQQANGEPTPTIKESFKDKLLNKDCSIKKDYARRMGKQPLYEEDDCDTVDLPDEDKSRIYIPWQFLVIVKLFNKRLAHNYLRIKLQDTWKPIEPLILIDRGNDFYTVKFIKSKNMLKALHEGPWPTSYPLGNGSRISRHTTQHKATLQYGLD